MIYIIISLIPGVGAGDTGGRIQPVSKKKSDFETARPRSRKLLQ